MLYSYSNSTLSFRLWKSPFQSNIRSLSFDTNISVSMSVNRQWQNFVEFGNAIVEKWFAQSGTDSGFERHAKVNHSIEDGGPCGILGVEKAEFSAGLQMCGSFHFAVQVSRGSKLFSNIVFFKNYTKLFLDSQTSFAFGLACLLFISSIVDPLT